MNALVVNSILRGNTLLCFPALFSTKFLLAEVEFHIQYIFLSTDGHAVPVGYYDARVRELRLVGQGNLWPGTTEK